MHMADALLSPAVGLSMAAASGAALAYSARRVSAARDDSQAPLMGVMGAFVFGAQMVNFTIPGTGSSGHLVGGTLLMILLGPWAALIVLTSVVVVQALFFADGGLLAIGANVWNMGVYSCLLGAIVYRAVAGRAPGRWGMMLGAMAAAVLSLELGAASVALETVFSGLSELPPSKFLPVMMGIHFPIGLIEGGVTVMVVNLAWRVRPELRDPAAARGSALRPALATFGLLALVTAGVFSWFASSLPDGLEWSLGKARGEPELTAPEGGVFGALAALQERLSILPGYDFKPGEAAPEKEDTKDAWPAVSVGTTVAGLIGAVIVLFAVILLGLVLIKLRPKPGPPAPGL